MRLVHLLGREAAGQQLSQSLDLIALGADDIHQEIILAELPHDLAANAAGRECAGDHTILAAADGDGGKVPVAVVNSLEKAVRSAQMVGL